MKNKKMEEEFAIKSAFKVGDKYFDKETDAKEFAQTLTTETIKIKKLLNYIKNLKKETREKLEETYKKENKEKNECHCGSSDFSNTCLKHLCTCSIFEEKIFKEQEYDHFICDYHTNLHFRNQGCYYCRHKDCSQFNC